MPLIKCPACQHDISDQAQACPNCGHPLTKPAPATNKGPAGCLVAGIVIAAIIGGVAFFGDRSEAPAFDANQPETITQIISEAKAHPAGRFENGKLSLTYSIDPWLLTASTAKSIFFSQAKTFFKDALARRLSNRPASKGRPPSMTSKETRARARPSNCACPAAMRSPCSGTRSTRTTYRKSRTAALFTLVSTSEPVAAAPSCPGLFPAGLKKAWTAPFTLAWTRITF